MKSNKMVKNVFLLMTLTLLSKFIGFFRELVMGYCYGASVHSDAYFTAYDIPKVLFSIIATAIATTFIPLYYKAKEERGEEGAIEFTNNIVSITLIVGIIISIVAFIFMNYLVNIFAIGFKGEALKETVLFARIMLLGYIFSGLSSIMSSYLQSNGEFFIPGITGIPYNIIVIASMFASAYTKNIYILPIGASLGLLSQYLIQIPKSKGFGYRLKFSINLKDKYIKEMCILVLPVLISVSVTQINTVVDRTLASTLAVGSMSSLNYSNKLMGFFIGLFITTISIVIYPQLSNLSNREDKSEFNDLIKKSINIVFILIVPIALVCIVLARPIIRVLFMRGAFDINAVRLTSWALIFYSVGMIGLAGRTVITKIYYSIGDTKTPMINSTFAVLLNIALSLILIHPLKNGGLALATSISYILSMIILLVKLKDKVGDYGVRNVFVTIAKTFVSSGIMAAVVVFLFNITSVVVSDKTLGDLIGLIISSSVGLLVYLSLVYILKINEIKMIFDFAVKKLKKSKK